MFSSDTLYTSSRTQIDWYMCSIQKSQTKWISSTIHQLIWGYHIFRWWSCEWPKNVHHYEAVVALDYKSTTKENKRKIIAGEIERYTEICFLFVEDIQWYGWLLENTEYNFIQGPNTYTKTVPAYQWTINQNIGTWSILWATKIMVLLLQPHLLYNQNKRTIIL